MAKKAQDLNNIDDNSFDENILTKRNEWDPIFMQNSGPIEQFAINRIRR